MQKTINGQSMINGTPAATMSATVYENGNVSISKNICNIELYESNKSEVRDDMANFENLVFYDDVSTQEVAE